MPIYPSHSMFPKSDRKNAYFGTDWILDFSPTTLEGTTWRLPTLCWKYSDAGQPQQLPKRQAEQQAGKNHKNDAHGLETKPLSDGRN